MSARFSVQNTNSSVGENESLTDNWRGSNSTAIPPPPLWKHFVTEIVSPFYIFQLFAIVVWSLDDYFLYGSCILLISIVSLIISLVATRKSMNNIYQLSLNKESVFVHNNPADCSTLSSSTSFHIKQCDDLRTGDVIKLMPPCVIPADIVLLDGVEGVVDEQMLTGESVPVVKVSCDRLKDSSALPKLPISLKEEEELHVLYGGTKFLSTTTNYPEVLAVVVRTGFKTAKGKLLLTLTKPRGSDFSFEKDGFTFLVCLAVIAILGFIVSAIRFASLGVCWQQIVLRACDVITVVIPPTLPAILSVGTSFAVGMLQTRRISTTVPSATTSAGGVDCVVLDKTGTITTDSLHVCGVVAADTAQAMASFEGLPANAICEIEDVSCLSTRDKQSPMLHCLSVAHSLSRLNGAVVGDTLDKAAFDVSGGRIIGKDEVESIWLKQSKAYLSPSSSIARSITMPPVISKSICGVIAEDPTRINIPTSLIVRRFPFSSETKRMSVLCAYLDDTIPLLSSSSSSSSSSESESRTLSESVRELYVKGAPDVIISLSNPESVPLAIHGTLKNIEEMGYRVIACARKTFKRVPMDSGATGDDSELYVALGSSSDDLDSTSTAPLDLITCSRDEVEHSLEFLGLVVVSNPLKQHSLGAISTIRQCGVPVIIATGDAVLTGVNVSVQGGVVNEDDVVYHSVVTKNPISGEDEISWNVVECTNTRRHLPPSLDPVSLRPVTCLEASTDNDDAESISTLSVSSAAGQGGSLAFSSSSLSSLSKSLASGTAHQVPIFTHSHGYRVAVSGAALELLVKDHETVVKHRLEVIARQKEEAELARLRTSKKRKSSSPVISLIRSSRFSASKSNDIVANINERFAEEEEEEELLHEGVSLLSKSPVRDILGDNEDDSLPIAMTSGATVPSTRSPSREDSKVSSAVCDVQEEGEVDEENVHISVNPSTSPTTLERVMQYACVFGRVKPFQKVQIINILQSLACRVMMIGDGGNDVGALRCASVGMSLRANDTEDPKDNEDSDVDVEEENGATTFEIDAPPCSLDIGVDLERGDMAIICEDNKLLVGSDEYCSTKSSKGSCPMSQSQLEGPPGSSSCSSSTLMSYSGSCSSSVGSSLGNSSVVGMEKSQKKKKRRRRLY
eukprot:gnl/Carplike_NY0171/1703_a2297_940.p1 GENE.gnl/Carplike_NY0171/1703_a2297_940~~gnl/Carplike_NY0171/1703_a2297_940.p1  ORF type:complete len:1148 (-),score=383.55 gnl/Carplike_NY0171/1703_a2297_940:289-3693(-)